jgi:hypothetical protein
VEQNRGHGYESTQLCPPYFDTGAKNIQRRKESLFNKYCREKLFSAAKKLKLDPFYHPVLISTQNGSRTLISETKL